MPQGTDFDADYWREPDSKIRVGDLFADVPLLTAELAPLTTEDEWGITRAYLPTLNGPALLFRQFGDFWWFLPILTPASFAAPHNFKLLLEQASAHAIPGWFPLPPPDSTTPEFSRPAIAYLTRPTLLRTELMEAIEFDRVATLTEGAMSRLHEEFARALDHE